MSAARFKVGDRVRVPDEWDELRAVVIAQPDGLNRIVVHDMRRDRYCIASQDAYELAPQRYTVELRVPKLGERYFHLDHTKFGDGSHSTARPVIVEDAS